MPDPQDQTPFYTYEKFAGAIRSLYPQLAHITDDGELTHAVVSTHPEFKQYVVDPLEGSERAGAPPKFDYPALKAPPNPDASVQGPVTRSRTGSLYTAPPFGAGLVEQVGMTPVTGTKRAIRGGQDLTQHLAERAGMAPPSGSLIDDLNNLIGGGMEASTVLLPAAAAEAPVALALGLTGGTGASVAGGAAARVLGAPPNVEELVSNLSGLIGGVAAGGGYAAREAGIARTKAAIGDQLAGEASTAAADAAREGRLNRVQEATDLARRDAEDEADQVALRRAQSFAADKATQVRAHAYASTAIDLYKNYPNGVNGGSAWDYLENLRQIRELGALVPDEALGIGTPPPKLLGPATTPRFIAGSPEDLNRLDFTGPPNQPIGVPSTPPPDITDEIGNLLQSQLEGQTPGPPRLGEGKSVVLTPPESHAAAGIDAAQQDLRFGGARRPKFPGAAEAVASGPEPPPAIDQAGLPLALPPQPDVAGLLPDERLELQRIHDEMSMGPYTPRTWLPEGQTHITEGGHEAPFVPGSGGAPVYHDILAEAGVKEGINPRTGKPYKTGSTPSREAIMASIADYLKTGKGIWGRRALNVARDRIKRSGYGGWEPPPSADLSAEPLPTATPEPEPTPRSFWSEEGHMILNVAPSDEAGIHQWLTDQQKEFGDEDWYKTAVDAANRGDTFTAWKLATQAAAKSFAGATAAEARSKYERLYPGLEPAPAGSTSPPTGDNGTAAFHSYWEMAPDQYHAQYNITSGPHGVGRTLGTKELTDLGIPIPETPPLPPGGRIYQPPGAPPPTLEDAPLGAVAARGRQGEPPPIVPLTEQQGAISDQMFAQSRPTVAKMEAEGAFAGDRSTMLKRLYRDEQGVLNVGPSNKAGMKKWLADREEAFGDEDWHQQATAALERGDTSTAWRIAALSWRSWMAPADIAQVETKRSGQPFAPEKTVAVVEKALGERLPYGTTIGEGGVVKLPNNPGGINPTATDLVLGRTFVKSLVDAIEPERIVHIEDVEGGRPADLPKALQVSSQMADEVLRRVPDSVIDSVEEVTGLDRAQQAAHLVRAASQAGKVLGTFGRFVQDNWDDLIHLSPETPIGGPGAASRVEFIPEDRAQQIVAYLDTLRRKGMTEGLAGDLKDFGFEVPTGVDPKVQERVARNWLRQQQKVNKWGQIVDAVAEKYKDVDKVTATAAMGQMPPIGRGIENASQLMLATLLGQPATWAKIAVTHGLRFALQSVVEEPIAGLASLARGRYAEATQHFQLAKRAATVDLTTAVPTGMLHSPTSETMEALFNYTQESVRDLPPDDLRRTLASIDEFPKQAARLSGAQMDDSGKLLEASPYRRIRNVLTLGIRATQVPTRAIVADAILRSLIYQKGDDPLEVFGNYGGLVEKYGQQEAGNMVGAAVSSALNYTFAGEPLPDSLVGKVLSTMRDIPGMAAVVRTGQPFVRFAFATIPRFIWDRMPGAFIADLPMKFLWQRGRMALGEQLDALQRPGGLLDTMRAEVATSQYKAAVAQTDMISARMQAADASKAFKAIEKRAAQTATLPDEVHAQMLGVSADLQDKIEAAQQAQRTYQQHDQESKILQQTYAQRVNRANQLREIDAPSPEQYIARQATGLGLMTLAFAIRGSQDNDGTKYYETRVTPGGAPVDLRHTVTGFAPYLHTADFFRDVWEHTDSAAYQKARAENHNIVDAMELAYHGKYTKPELLKEAVADWLSISPVVGDSAIITDLLTGRAPETLAGSSLTDGPRHFLALVGEQLGRLTMPLKALKDVAGAVYEPESHNRTPQRPGPETGFGEELFGPAAKNIPGVNELLPERVSPMTGEPVATQHGLLHQLTGITYYQPLTKFEEELNRTGIPYGKAVPKITGDRDFDNLVAKFYAGAVQQHLPTVLNDHRYQALPPDLRREVLTEVIGSLRAVARVAVASELRPKPGESDDQFRRRMLTLAKGPEGIQKADRWAAQNEKAAKQEAAEMPAAQQEPEPQEPPRPGAPPPSL